MLSTPATIATARRVLGLTPDELGDLLFQVLFLYLIHIRR